MRDDVVEVSKDCPDCAVKPGQPHLDGCDVARCTEHGQQRLMCEGDSDHGWGQVWTGVWPGTVECDEWDWWAIRPNTIAQMPEGLPDLNRLAVAAIHGEVVWDIAAQRYVKP